MDVIQDSHKNISTLLCTETSQRSAEAKNAWSYTSTPSMSYVVFNQAKDTFSWRGA
jgi:hypothetical protein